MQVCVIGWLHHAKKEKIENYARTVTFQYLIYKNAIVSYRTLKSKIRATHARQICGVQKYIHPSPDAYNNSIMVNKQPNPCGLFHQDDGKKCTSIRRTIYTTCPNMVTTQV